MNAVLKTETVAIEAAAPLEAADPTKNLILVPLSQLLPRRSKRNVRTTPRQSIPELAASIARIGLLQNLIVILSADGEAYEVVAGDRRLTALKLLAKKKRIPADYEVPCLLVADASARTVSLAENVQRENMHPADQFADGSRTTRPASLWSFHATPQDWRRQVRRGCSRLSLGG